MDKIARIGVFVTVVEEQSFAGAARILGVTSSAVSKQVQNLEQDLQVKLLNRTTRSVSVTEEGEIYYERTKRALDSLQDAQDGNKRTESHPTRVLENQPPTKLGPTVSM